MRRVSVSLIVLYVLVATAAGAGAAEDIGRFGLPFREDGAKYTLPSAEAPNGSFASAKRDDTGCTQPDADGHRDCLPAGATLVMLANRDVLYWNAIEGEEDVPVGLVPQLGFYALNDQSRLLRIRSAPRWLRPRPLDGGAANAESEEPLPMKAESGATNDGSLFCSDQKLLADGRVIAVGGTDYYAEPGVNEAKVGISELEGVKAVRIFDSKTNTWTKAASMHYGRWYPSLVTLGDGRLFVASGVTKLVKPVYPSHPMDSGTNVTQTEIYDPKRNTWTDNSTSNPESSRSLPLFARLHLLPNGNVYYDAAGQAYNPSGQAYDEAFWNLAAVYNPKTNAWSDLGVPGLGSSPFPGFRGSTFSAVLPLKAPYSSASFLTGGGVIFPTPGSYLPVADTRINTVGGDAGEETLNTINAGAMGRARWYSTAVPLPDGTVLAVSGADADEVISPGAESPIHTAEIFTPTYDSKGVVTGGEWRDAGVAYRGRTYHNNAILMPDGRVLVGGHAPIANGYGANSNNPHLPVREAANNFKDASFEIYSPPYLSRGPRPVIGGMSSSIARGTKVTIPVSGAKAADISSVVLMRNTAQTHLVDGDARTVELIVTKRTASSVTVIVPSSANVLPAGPYLLFINRKTSKGPVPSVAKQLFVR